MAKPKHIAVIRLSAMGDVAMTVPVLRALVLQYPEVKLTVVSRPFFQPFFRDIPNVNFFAVDVKQRHKGFVGLLRLFNDLRKLNIDAVADLHNVLRSHVVRNLFTLSGKATATTDKGRAAKKALTRAENKVLEPVKPMVERHADTFKALGLPINLAHPKFPAKTVLTPEVITVTGLKDQKWIGIAPFAQYQSKVYPLDLLQEVIDQLALDLENKLLLFGGGAKEIQLLNQLKKNHVNVEVVAGKLNLNQELDLISNLDVMLSMDSGNAHIAAMLGVKVITLWGATHPYAGFVPFNQPMENCIIADRDKYPLLPTSVYGNKEVPGYEDAMRTISPQTVINTIKKELK
ncbi:glycosyltransferase family 9 protein [Flavobacterium sp. SM15]|uniref:glycosyltransferase family 9 protein n=1 Tax=Flavobacterium sp. SM15 TaxID=2908005 RepID=UPI001EDAB73F|nr:glycosyltransferase family 9 protein [Flavobacterium sp. SM15]MCG2610350.1 glycosyltransferase family 9 protein [Flavobacterium sp. SM15]